MSACPLLLTFHSLLLPDSILSPEVSIIGHLFFIFERLQFALVVEAEEGLGVIFDMVDEDNAITMVNFVLENARQEILGGHPELLAVDIQRFNLDLLVPWHLAVNARHAEAALEVLDDIAFALGDLWVNKYRKGMILFVVIIITNHNDFVEPIDLNGGQRYANFMIATLVPADSCGLHVFDNLLNLVGNNADALRLLS